MWSPFLVKADMVIALHETRQGKEEEVWGGQEVVTLSNRNSGGGVGQVKVISQDMFRRVTPR